MGNTSARPFPTPRNKKQVRWKAADRPSPPGKPSLVQENGSVPDIVHICWQKPVKDGGSPVVSYLVEHRRLGSTHWVKACPLPVLNTDLAVGGLEAGWRYQFRVRAENPVGISDPSEISEPFTVTLQRSAILAPKFVQGFQDTVALENAKVEFEVHFMGQPAPTICWFKDGFEIFGGNRTRITTVSDKSLLTILHTTATDEGEIKCTATNRAGHTTVRAKLTIEAPPSIRLPKSYQDQDGIIFELGEKIRLNVYVYGRPTPLIFWSHDGETMQNDDRHELEYVDRTATVSIEDAVRSDRGEYQIRAVNKLGQDSASFLVTITDKPAPPGKARVILTSGRTVTLSWSTPADDGGCEIGNYIIEYYKIGWDVWLKAATSRQLTTMLGDLIEGSQYKFRVKAESPYGVSDPSEESETVFIPDPKRGITEPNDALAQIENQPFFPVDIPRNKRGGSSPRVSFALQDEVPVRPERKKTGKTPEASPRMKRKIFPLPSDLKENVKIQADKSPSPRRFSLPYPFSAPDRRSNTPSPTSPLSRNMAFNFSEAVPKPKSPSKNEKRNESKTPSPDIKITEAEAINFAKKSPSRSPDHSPKKSPSPIQGTTKLSPTRGNASRNHGKNDTEEPKDNGQLRQEDSIPNQKTQDRMRSQLTHQQFSGSSEFMLVLCPEEEQGLQFKKFGISFDENSVPPPLSLSAPELGIEPPANVLLIRSSSSTELLNYRLMERMNEATLEDERRNAHNEGGVKGIPTIQVNSKPALDLVGLDGKQSVKRRFSSGAVLKQRSKWSPRRQSLQNPSDVKSVFENALYKFEETDENRKELMKYRDQEKYGNNRVSREKESEEDDWMKGYEESIPSDEDSEYSADDSFAFVSYDDSDQKENETYNPRERMMTAVKVDNERPFEILTVRKEPPHSNIIPKPILKKKPQDDIHPQNDTPFSDTIRSRGTAGFLTDTPLNLRGNSPLENRKDEIIPVRSRSNSLIGAYDELLDVNQIKKSPTITKRRSFSLIPTQANFIKDAFKNKNKKDDSSFSPPKEKSKRNISALANSTSIAGAGLFLAETAAEQKVVDEEAKVVVDFYGDIVKSFGGKTKPIAEFSRSAASKYDTYEERKLTEIKSNIDTPQEKQKIIENAPKRPTESHKLVRQDTPSGLYTTNTQNNSSITEQERWQDPNSRKLIHDNRVNENRMTPSFFANRISQQVQHSADTHSRPNSITRRKKVPRSRDASTSPVRFDSWGSRSSSRNSIEHGDYYRDNLTSSRASSLTRSLSPKPKLREITTQTSFRIEPKTPADILKKQEELASKAERRMRGVFEYFTDLAMVSVACWLYLFQNEYFAIPILVTLVYRQLGETMVTVREKVKRRIPRWIMKKFERGNNIQDS